MTKYPAFSVFIADPWVFNPGGFVMYWALRLVYVSVQRLGAKTK